VCVDGLCVECAEGKEEACVELTPVCDDATNICVGCSAHEQCPDSACNLAAGNCIDPANIVHVEGDTLPGNCAAADGSESMPYCTIQEAINNGPTEPLIIIHEQAGDDPYTEALNLQNAFAFFGAPGESPILQGTNNSPAITVTGSGTLFARGLTISGTPNMQAGLSVAGGQVWADSCRLNNNAGGGITVDGGGALMLENSFVSGSADSPALRVSDGTFELLYATLGLPPSLGGPALECTDGSLSTVRNSLITSTEADPEVDCPNLTITGSALEISQGDNVALGNLDVGWFGGYLAGNYLLSGTHPAAIDTAATWQTGDPPTDIEGDARPTAGGSSDAAGADVP
jgi:hypothetical protein